MAINQIGEIASGILQYDFDFITGAEAQASELLTISGSLSGSLGELNILLNQGFTYTGSDGNPSPRLGIEESDILKQVYIRDWNTKQAQKLLRGVYDTSTAGSVVGATEWTELREGDTTIRRSPESSTTSSKARMTMSKDFKALAEEARIKINGLVASYNTYGSQPRQVAGAGYYTATGSDGCPLYY